MKVIGKRKMNNPNVFEDCRVLQHTLNQIRKVGLCPKGVYRFRSFEEANRWMETQNVLLSRQSYVTNK